MYYVGLDIGGMSIKAGLVDENGSIVYSESVPTLVERGPMPIIKDMTDISFRVAEKAGVSFESDVGGVGIGFPGIIDPRTNRVAFCTNLYWHDVPMLQTMGERIHKPMAAQNDATVAALAEAVAGVSAGCQNSVFITLGTGVGSGLVVNGKIFSGSHGVGGEMGHTLTMMRGGHKCSCGAFGCWEQYASAPALMRMGRECAQKNPDGAMYRAVGGKLDDITGKLILDLAKEGAPDAYSVFDEYAYNVAVGCINLINTFDPEVIALGGGISKAGPILRDAVRKKIPPMLFYKTMPYARIELAALGNDAGIIGAAMLVKN